MRSGLAARLRSETSDLHAAAERSPFMAELLAGRLDRDAYAALLANLLVIYEALEPALARHASHPAIALLDCAALARTPALRADLASLGTRATAPTQASAARYAGRIEELGATRPEPLVAHAYVRYLGDLSGGQMLRRVVARSTNLGAGVGTAFYDFGDDAEVAARAQRFREGLDVAPIVDLEVVVAEAKLAFEWHCTLFDELAVATGVPR
ncbi:MAG TPA: biliverdin-producing heme oxygenase [Caldimonas sp.]|nr:biliverdin-producing heme oxygenase [Caldimonas sp.]